jgi:hypothetical protein
VGPAVAVAPERNPADPTEAARQIFLSLGHRLLLRGRGRRPTALPLVCARPDGSLDNGGWR